MNIYPLIMAGGVGTRFWPFSTRKCPKQYLYFFDQDSLIQKTCARFEKDIFKEIFVVTTKEQKELALAQLEGKISETSLILEPSGRNTAPCIFLSLLHLISQGIDEESVIAVCPSDHLVINKEAFQNDILRAADLSYKNDKIVLLGIKPHIPHTGYGYIEVEGRALKSDAFLVLSFKEKPSMPKAIEYLEKGNYYFNAGIFVGKISTFFKEFKFYAQDIFSFYQIFLEKLRKKESIDSVYEGLEKVSIDYAIMEKSKNLLLVEALFDWTDLGSWDALEGVYSEKDENTLVSSEGHYFENAKKNIIFAPRHFVSLIDVDDLIVSINDKAVLITKKSSAQKIKNTVEFLEKDKSMNNLI